MAITQINPDSGVFDYEAMLNALIDSYKANNTLTLTNYDNDSAPQVTAGSIFENNGALFSNDALATPTGYSGISNSTTFYLYYDVSAGVFIYSSTAPTWSDAKQGWYNGNDRAFFSMFKDSGGALYQIKRLLINQSKTQIDNLTIQNDLDVVRNITYAAKFITVANYLHASGGSLGALFTKLSPFIPTNGDIMILNGSIFVGATDISTVSRAHRLNGTTIQVYGVKATTGALLITSVASGSGTPLDASLSW